MAEFKLAWIQQKLKAPKSQFNKFGGYNYRNCEDILEALKPLLGDTALTISDEIILIGSRYYIKATASLTQEGKILASSIAYAREAESKKGMDEAQVTGAASSYARKYALNGLFAIDDTKDPDATNKHEKNGTQPKKDVPKPGEAFGTIEKVERKEGVTKGKPWTRYGIYLTDVDTPYGTFDTKIGTQAEQLIGQEVGLAYKSEVRNEKVFLTCTGIDDATPNFGHEEEPEFP